MNEATDSIHILHVDDEPDFADMAAEFLEREDDRLSVETSTSAGEGLERLAETEFDCVVADYDMPGRNGIEFLKAVREEYPDLPFVLFTGKGSEEVASEAISAGVTDYLQKDAGREQYELLANRITNVVTQSRTQQRLDAQRRQLEQLHEATRELMAAETRAEVAERASATTRDVLDLPLNGIHFYDSDRDGLVPVAVADEVYDVLGEPPVIGPGEGVAWTAYETGDAQIYGDVRDAPEVLNPDTPIRSEFHIPLGEHGVLVAASTTPDDFARTDITSAKILAANVETALNRAEREGERRRKERRYQAIFNDPNILVGLIDTDGTVLDVNQTAIEYIDATRDEVTGNPFWKTPWFEHSEAIQDRVKRWIDRATNGEYVEFEVDLVRPNGEPYTVEGVFRPVTNDDGEVVSLIISDRDITERKERERELERYERLVEVMGDAVYTLDPDGYIVEVNEQFESLTGYDRDDLLGEHVSILLDEEDIAKGKRTIKELLSNEDKRVETYEETIHTADGGTVRCETRQALLPSGDGEFQGTVGTVRDITTRKERERELERYGTILEALGDPVYVIDAEGRYSFVNDAFVEETGYPEEEIIGEHVSRIIPGDNIGNTGRVIEELLTDNEQTKATVELEQVTADGERIQAESHIALLPPDEDGEFRGIAGVVRDISDRKEREQALEEVKERLELALDGANLGVWDWNVETGEVTYDARWAEMLGHSLEELDPDVSTWRERVHPDDIGRVDEVVNEHFEGETDHYQCDHRMRTKSGDWKWVRSIGKAVERDRNGEPVRTVGIHQDIADRKERERELERYETIVEALGDPVYAIDDEGCYTFVNDAFTEMTGYTEGELLGEHTSIVVGEEAIEKGIELTRELLRAGDETTRTCEMEVMTADGEHIPCENHIALLPFDEDGEFRGTAGVIRDITERKRREEALTTLHEATRAFIEAPDEQTVADRAVETARTVLDRPINGIWLYDESEDALLPAAFTDEGAELVDEVFTYRRGEGLSWDAFEAGEVRIYDDLRDVRGRINPDGPIQSEIILPLGEYGVMNIGSTGAQDFDDIDVSLARILANTVEAALARADREGELRTQRRAVERQNERLEEFAGIVSHDLRNPLNVADGRVELARAECDSEHLDAAGEALDRMDQLIDRTLTLARSGRVVGETEPVDLSRLTEQCWRNVGTANSNLRIEDVPEIEADPERLQHLFENLYRNSVEHGGEDVTVTVGGLDDDNGFYVEDDGPGIPEDEREEVLTAGYSTTEDGTGLGLSIVRQIAEAHGWDIRVTESKAGGARFEITGVQSV